MSHNLAFRICQTLALLALLADELLTVWSCLLRLALHDINCLHKVFFGPMGPASLLCDCDRIPGRSCCQVAGVRASRTRAKHLTTGPSSSELQVAIVTCLRLHSPLICRGLPMCRGQTPQYCPVLWCSLGPGAQHGMMGTCTLPEQSLPCCCCEHADRVSLAQHQYGC